MWHAKKSSSRETDTNIDDQLQFSSANLMNITNFLLFYYSSLAELDNNLDDMEAAVLAQSNLLSVAPFGMDLDVHSNRSSVVAPVRDLQ